MAVTGKARIVWAVVADVLALGVPVSILADRMLVACALTAAGLVIMFGVVRPGDILDLYPYRQPAGRAGRDGGRDDLQTTEGALT